MRPARFAAGAAAIALSALAAGAAGAETVSHGVSAFGGLKYPADYAHFDYVNPDAPKGGVYRGRSTFAARTFDSLNPFILKGEPALEISMFVFETLLTRAWDEPDAAYGLLAESVTLPDDRSWAEFALRPDARFDGGAPVTADDVVFSTEILKAEGSPSWRAQLAAIERVEALDARRVRFTFRPGAPTRDLPALAGSIPIMPRAYWEGRDFAESTLDPPIGSGPYRIGEVRPGRSISYIRRKDYWAQDLPVARGKWNFDELRYEYFKDSTAAFEAFKSGEYDLHEEFYSKLWATAYDFPAVQKGWVKREVLPDGRPSGAQGYWFNLRRAKFADIRVREALALGFDFEWSNRTLFYGLYHRTDSFFEGSPLEARGEPSEAELELLRPLADDLPPGVLTEEAYVPPKTDGSGRMRRLLRRAGRLLDAAGWKVGADGLRRNAAGETLSVEFLSDSPAFERITNPYISNLRLMGVDARYRLIDAAQYQQRTKDFDFDIVVARMPMAVTPGHEIRNLFHSETANARGSLNLAGIDNPAIDALVEAVGAAKTRAAHAAAVSALDRALRALHVWVPQWAKGSHTIAYWDRFGRPPSKPPYSRAIVETWWWDAARSAALDAARAE